MPVHSAHCDELAASPLLSSPPRPLFAALHQAPDGSGCVREEGLAACDEAHLNRMEPHHRRCLNAESTSPQQEIYIYIYPAGFQNLILCSTKETHTGLEQHEAEWTIYECSFLGELSLVNMMAGTPELQLHVLSFSYNIFLFFPVFFDGWPGYTGEANKPWFDFSVMAVYDDWCPDLGPLSVIMALQDCIILFVCSPSCSDSKGPTEIRYRTRANVIHLFCCGVIFNNIFFG